MKDVQLPHYKEDCTAAFFDAIHRLDMESITQFIEAKPPGFLVSLVDAQGNSPLHVALQVANAQAATQATTLAPLQQEIIQLFLTLQCDERQRNKQGLTPLDLAAQCPTAAIRALFPALCVPPVELPPVEVASPRVVSAVTSPRASEAARAAESGLEAQRGEGKGVDVSRGSMDVSRVSIDSSRVSIEPSRVSIEPSRVSIEPPQTRIPIDTPRIPIDTPRIPIDTPTSRIPTTTKTPSESTTKASEETGNEETADEETSPSASQTQLQPSSTVEELLQTLGLQEYIDVFREKVGDGRSVERRATRCVRTSSRSTRRTSRRWE